MIIAAAAAAVAAATVGNVIVVMYEHIVTGGKALGSVKSLSFLLQILNSERDEDR